MAWAPTATSALGWGRGWLWPKCRVRAVWRLTFYAAFPRWAPDGPQSSTLISKRSTVSTYLKSNKDQHSIEYLGCTIGEFKEHLQSQFDDNMTWDNYGSYWHIDHKVPLKFNNPTLEEVIERLHWKNTQPLEASANIAKGNRWCD